MLVAVRLRILSVPAKCGKDNVHKKLDHSMTLEYHAYKERLAWIAGAFICQCSYAASLVKNVRGSMPNTQSIWVGDRQSHKGE